MNDNRQVYRSINNPIGQFYANESKGNLTLQLNTLTALMTGIVQSNQSQFPLIDGKVPDDTKLESRVMKYRRWIQKEQNDLEIYYLPFVRELLAALAETRTLLLVMESSEVGRNCPALILSMVYKGRTLPIVWIVVKGSKGHFPAANYVALLHEARQLIPAGADVIFLGDEEFDSTILQASIKAYGWAYVCRAEENIILQEDGVEFSLKDLVVAPGDCLSLPQVLFTQQGFGPVHVIAWWRAGCKEPLYLVTNLELAEEACHWYARRLRSETFFSDEKDRIF